MPAAPDRTSLVAPPKWLLPVVLAAAAIAFAPSLNGGFLADDFAYIARFRNLPWSEWPALFFHDWSGGIWGERLRELRPFVALSFMSDARLFGGDALGYRLTNLGLHLVSTLLVTRLAWTYASAALAGNRVTRQPALCALVAGTVFALHPAHAEAVGWITGRVDLQATAAALLFWAAAEAFVAHGGLHRAVVAWLAFFVGVFSKELCLFAPLLLLLKWLLLDPRPDGAVWRKRIHLLAGVAVLLVGYAVCRRLAFGHDNIGYNLWTDEPAWHRQANYAGWLVPVLPFASRGEWTAFPPLVGLHALWVGVAALALGGLAVACWRQARAGAWVLFFAGTWYLVTVFPLTGVVYFSPRHLYFPSVGIALAMGLACGGLRAGRVLGVLLIAWCALGHVFALRPWRHAGEVSRAALATLQSHITTAPDALLVTAVPETLGPTLFWAWSSPHCVNPPFVSPAPRRVMERPANYIRSSQWTEDRQPGRTVGEATTAIALAIDDHGGIVCRTVSGAAWRRHQETFAQLLARNALSPESWTEWVNSVARQ